MTISHKTGRPFPRGARRSPPHRLAAATPHLALTAPPPTFGVSVKRSNLGYWGNDQYGDCVSAEEAWAKVYWSILCGQPVTEPTDQEVVNFANQYGYLNGADLSSVLDTMRTQGMSIGGKIYKDGNASSVDYTNLTVLQSALTVGPVKIAIDANALPGGAGNQQGWYSFGGSPGQFPNTDHCIGYGPYGTASFCFGLLGVPVPSGVDPSKPDCIVAFTWDTEGVVDLAWTESTCVEAWVRNPTTVGQVPTPPTPPTPIPPGPTPTPAFAIASLGESLAFGKWSNGMAIGSTAPITGTAKITGLQGIDAPRELAGMAIPLPILLLLYFFKDQLLPLVLADIQAGKTWAQIGMDILAKLLGPQGNVIARARNVIDRRSIK